MNLPWKDAEYFLAAHACWALSAKQMRLEGNLEAARIYAWQASSARAASGARV